MLKIVRLISKNMIYEVEVFYVVINVVIESEFSERK